MRAAGDRGARTRLHRVEAEALDRAVPAGYRPDFVKPDVEGAELYDFVTGSLDHVIFKPSDFLAEGAALSRATFARTQTYPFQAFDFVAEPRSGAPPAEPA
jgi:hypothetical protein